jgi:hypothetical protein
VFSFALVLAGVVIGERPPFAVGTCGRTARVLTVARPVRAANALVCTAGGRDFDLPPGIVECDSLDLATNKLHLVFAPDQVEDKEIGEP